MTTREDTARAIAILYAFIEQFTDANGFAPTNREMQPSVNNIGRVQHLINVMSKKGYIHLIPDERRNVRLVQAPTIPEDIRAMRFDTTPLTMPPNFKSKGAKGRRINDGDKMIGTGIEQQPIKGWKTIQDLRNVQIHLSFGESDEPRVHINKGGKYRIIVMREREGTE